MRSATLLFCRNVTIPLYGGAEARVAWKRVPEISVRRERLTNVASYARFIMTLTREHRAKNIAKPSTSARPDAQSSCSSSILGFCLRICLLLWSSRTPRESCLQKVS